MSLERITVIILILMGIHFSIAFTTKWYDTNHKERQKMCGIIVNQYQELVKARNSYYRDWIQIKDVNNNMYEFSLHIEIKKQVKAQNIGQNSKVCVQFVHSSYSIGGLGDKKIDKWLLHIEKQ